MTLKDTISKWHRATCLLEEGRSKEAMQTLMQIDNPSAKIVYNLGCISMIMELYTDAIEYFTSSLEKDKYLAISYFQRGVCFYKIRSFSSAERDFDSARSMVTAEGIDYRQLGAKVILHTKMIDNYSRLCKHYTDTNMPAPTQTSFLDLVFYPPKKMVANLKKEDFLGKAKVISSVQESDILYAESKSPREKAPKKSMTGGVNKSSLSASMMHLSSTVTLPSTSSRSPSPSPLGNRISAAAARPPCRPPPRLGRSHSLGDLLDTGGGGIGADETDSSSSRNTRIAPSSSSSLAVPAAAAAAKSCDLQKRQSTGDNNYYSHMTHQDSYDSFSNYMRLSVSSPVLDQQQKPNHNNNNNDSNHNNNGNGNTGVPRIKKPMVPQRPVVDRSRDGMLKRNGDNDNNNNPSLSPQQPRLSEIQKIQEALKGKLNLDGGALLLPNNNNNNNKLCDAQWNDKASKPNQHQNPSSNKDNNKPFVVSKSQSELDKLVPPRRLLTHSQPNLMAGRPLPVPVPKNDSRTNNANSNTNTANVVFGAAATHTTTKHNNSNQVSSSSSSASTTSKPPRPPIPFPRKSPDRTLDGDNKSTPPPRPPPPRKS